MPGFDRTGGSVTFWIVVLFGLFGVPWLHAHGMLGTDNVTKLGLYLGYAILAVGLDLVWGYSGVLCLCQCCFSRLGGYAMGMYLAMHGPRMRACAPFRAACTSSRRSVKGFKLPWFWAALRVDALWRSQPAWHSGPGGFGVGYFGFASRVRGVYFRHSDASAHASRLECVLLEQHAALRHQRPDELYVYRRLGSDRIPK